MMATWKKCGCWLQQHGATWKQNAAGGCLIIATWKQNAAGGCLMAHGDHVDGCLIGVASLLYGLLCMAFMLINIITFT